MSQAPRFPAIYIPHGGGPWPFFDRGAASREEMAPLAAYLRALVSSLPQRPHTVLMVSAHWEAAVPTVMTSAQPPMLYDYGGFPPETYRLQWPAPGSPEGVAAVLRLLERAGFRTATDPLRGYDHGTFVPMMLALPQADIAVVQVSLLRSLDPAQHLALGRALVPLRSQGMLLLGSGNSYHNMRGFGRPESLAPSLAFDNWMADAVRQSPAEREALLTHWEAAPFARACHPREEHLLPLHVMAGAADGDAATLPLRGVFSGVHASAVQFG